MDPATQGRPWLRKPFTELLPVTLPIAASAVGSSTAATFEAKVSGREVPKATMVMAVMESLMSATQPSSVAKSPMKTVTTPIISSAVEKHSQPPQYDGGGVKAKSNFQGKAMKC